MHACKCQLARLTSPFISTRNPIRPGGAVTPPRSSKGTLLNTVKTNTIYHLSEQFLLQTHEIMELLTIPTPKNNTDSSVGCIKKDILITTCISLRLFMIFAPQTYNSVCIKCHNSRPFGRQLALILIILFVI